MTGEAAAIATATGAHQDRSGRIVVQPDLTVPVRPEISVAGDMMNSGGLPGVAEVAMQAGLYAARRIRREWAWLVIHIGFRNRFGAVASWWFAFTRDLRCRRTFTSRDVGVVRDVYGEDVATMVAATNTAGPPAPPDPAASAGPGKPARDRQ